MALVVQKFGGSSLATPAHIRRAAQRIRAVKDAGHDVVVVVSAMGRMTDHLISLARRTVKRPPQRELDMLLTAGERVSMALLAMALEDDGVPAISFTGSQTGIVTSSHHTEARIEAVRPVRAREELAKGRVVIVAGFQGVSERKEVTTLGRGGSDTTAVALAASLGATRCEILTDVEGLCSADPRIIPHARVLPFLTYDEALELASLGAKMHARSLEVAKRFNVTVRIVSSYRDDVDGTWIGADRPQGDCMEQTTIRGVPSKDGYSLLRARCGLGRVADLALEFQTAIRFFAVEGEDVRFLVERAKAPAMQEAFERAGVLCSTTPRMAIVSIVGDGLSSAPAVLPKFLSIIASTGAVAPIVVSNALSVTAAVPSEELAAIVQRLHDAFLEDGAEAQKKRSQASEERLAPETRGLGLNSANPASN